MDSTTDPRSETPSTPSNETGIPYRRRSRILNGAFGLSGRLYATVSGSLLGRGATAYRTLDHALGGKRRREYRCRRTVTRGRLLAVETVNRSRVLHAFCGIGRFLYDLPMRFYGLFALLYGAYGVLNYLVLNLLLPEHAPDSSYLTVAVTMLLLCIPPLSTRATLRTSVSRSRFSALILKSYLCIPIDPSVRKHRKMPVGIAFLAVLLGISAAIGATFISPLTIPLILLAVMLVGMVFAYPETGALLATAALPLVWMIPSAMLPLVMLIILTWCSYGVKLLRLHRAMHADILDIVGGLFLMLTLISGVGGWIAGTGYARPALELFCCLSVYFLIVHLLNTRAYIKRCLFGVGTTALLTTLVGLILRMDEASFAWIRGTHGGELLNNLFEQASAPIYGTDALSLSLLTVMTFPLLCTFLIRSKRLFSRVSSLFFLLLNVHLIATSGSLGTILCTLCVTLFFCLFMSHRALAVMGLCLPGAVGAIGWYMTWRGPISAETIESLSWTRFVRDTRAAELWQIVCDHPVGLGIGAACEGGNLFLEVLINLGWQGLIVVILFLLLLAQKGLTALRHTITFTDRALLVGLIGGIVGFLLRGITHGFLADPRAILTLTILSALVSVLADVLFEESDVRAAESLHTDWGIDRMYHRL